MKEAKLSKYFLNNYMQICFFSLKNCKKSTSIHYIFFLFAKTSFVFPRPISLLPRLLHFFTALMVFVAVRIGQRTHRSIHTSRESHSAFAVT